MNKKAVVLVSGGVDSSTVLAMVGKMGFEIHAITFNYLQRHSVEIVKIKGFIKDYPIKQHKLINIDLRSFGGSALTSDEIDVPKYTSANELKSDIPVTYVPARNTIFLSYALGFAEVVGAYDIFIGAHAVDYANYPDCRPEYLKSFEDMANLATAAGVSGKRISIHAPLINMSKGEIISAGLKIGVDYSKTISCYDPSEKGESCGKCHACLIRIEGFAKNQIKDPIAYVC
jgi:7-cyano-7-deazaguanine synthase